VREAAAKLGLHAKVAHVEGDDLRGALGAIVPPVEGKPVSASFTTTSPPLRATSVEYAQHGTDPMPSVALINVYALGPL
jgi:hypothetical protein